MDCSPLGSSVHGISPGKNTGMNCFFLLQGISQSQGSNPCLLSPVFPSLAGGFFTTEPPTSTGMWMLNHYRRVQLCATLWTSACPASPSMGFSRQEYWSGLLCPPPGDFADPGIEPESFKSTCTGGSSLPLATPGKLKGTDIWKQMGNIPLQRLEGKGKVVPL